jgi:hypothetical protein
MICLWLDMQARLKVQLTSLVGCVNSDAMETRRQTKTKHTNENTRKTENKVHKIKGILYRNKTI